ncbi:MAG: 2-oxoglutarate and iron-dependent oxygenase domain-containing protein, partial [Pseudonocardia sp.]|nr:2-oxoglutarate and iron-dependent oxygenase domain-containing protein [Pseudonocardia sp.]
MTTPLIDLAAHARGTGPEQRAIERALDEHLRHTGFLLVAGHGVDAALIDRTRTMAGRFFALDDDVKGTFAP